jgi:putative FmdB family regulatory protein
MPTYDYVCHQCGHRFEVIHGVHAEGPLTCPNCGGGPVRKAFAAPAIHFKGSGWAKKDRGGSRSGSGSRKADEAGDAAAAATSAGGDGDARSGGSSEGSKPADPKGSSTKPAPSAGEGG